MNIWTGPLFLGSTVPFGRPSASSENSFILSFCLTITTASLSDPVQNTTPEGILSLCWCSLVLALITSMGTWDGAGATRSWLHSPGWSKFLVLIRKSLNSTKLFHLGERRNAQRWQSSTNWRLKKICPEARKSMLPWNIDPFLYNCPVLVDFLWFLINCLWNLSISLFSCAKAEFGCCWFVAQYCRIPPQDGNLFEEWTS